MRYFLKLAYDGATFHGWQRQANAISVQGVLEQALSTILRTETTVQGCGRTDTGVHASTYYAHFDSDVISKEMDLAYKLNALLPDSIAIHGLYPMIDDAHARFSATARSYQYHIIQRKDPFKVDHAWLIHQSLNLEEMRKAAAVLIGQKDFRSFCKQAEEMDHHLCDLSELNIEQKEEIRIDITANRFLRNMVRAIVGTLVEIGKGKMESGEMEKILSAQDRSMAGVSAPAKGLFLTNIVYPQSLFLDE